MNLFPAKFKELVGIIIFLFLVILIGSSSVYLIFRLFSSKLSFNSIGLASFSIGFFFESIRISNSLKTVLYTFAGAFVFSLIVTIIVSLKEDFLSDENLSEWFIIFLAVYAIFTLFASYEKLNLKLTEGIVLLQSLSFIYLIWDPGFFFFSSWLLNIPLILVYFFTLLSFLIALTSIELPDFLKFMLSIHSSFIMLLFNIYFILRTLSLDQIYTSSNPIHNYAYQLNYFLLGFSAIYIMKNFSMLLSLIPYRDSKLGITFATHYSEVYKNHVSRFSNQQLKLSHTIIALSVTLILFSLNHYLKLFHKTTVILLVFIIVPFMINLIVIKTSKRNGKRNSYSSL